MELTGSIDLELVVQGAVVLVLFTAVSYLSKLFQVYKDTRGQPGYWAFFAPFSFYPLLFLPFGWRFNYQRLTNWTCKTDLFVKHNSSVITVRSFIPPSKCLLVGDPNAYRIIHGDGRGFEKPNGYTSKLVDIWGWNILNSNGDIWRRHRKITTPGFSESNTIEVWDVAHQVIGGWISQLGDVKTIDQLEEDLSLLTLTVICQALFGKEIPFPEHGHERTPGFTTHIRVVFDKFMIRWALPK